MRILSVALVVAVLIQALAAGPASAQVTLEPIRPMEEQPATSVSSAAPRMNPPAPPPTAAFGVPATVGVPEATGPPTNRTPAILGVYPNPIHHGDPGEFVIVRLPPDATGTWTIADDHRSVDLPSHATGIVAATPEPWLVRPIVDVTVVQVGDDLRLADAGETIRLLHDGEVVDEVTYGRAPQGELFRPGDGWEPLGATNFQPTASGPASVHPFVLPDAPEMPVQIFRTADRRILLAGYTLSDRRVVRELLDAHERGVEVRVLVEGGPVGGFSQRSAALLDVLDGAGIEVRAVGGPRDRYGFHHAKYAVVDNRSIVLSENWKPAGTGGRASRGWGVVVDDHATAAQLARVFQADAGWRDGLTWTEFRRETTFYPSEPADGTYPTRFEPRTMEAESVSVLLAPENVESEVLTLIESADERVLVQQVTIGDRTFPFLEATVDAARRGVEVQILLSSAWYVRDDNAKLAQWLNEVAAIEGLPLEAKLADSGSRFEKIHNKGVVVDGERVLVGSVNWNNHSVRQNREVALVLEGTEVAGYYERTFEADWRGGWWRFPVGVGIAVLVATGLATWFGRREISFES